MSTVSFIEYPRLRQLDVRTQMQNGQPYFLLRDPLQLSEGSLLVPQLWGVILAHMDGATSIGEAADAFYRQFGVPMTADDVKELVTALDEACLLDNERAHEARQRTLDAYRSAPYRQPLLAGTGYPGTAGDLHDFLDGHLTALGEPVMRPDLVDAVDDGHFGVLSPHIDYARGGDVYARVWRQAADAVRAADLVVLLGTDHYGSDPFTLTRQHYATPYGVLPTATNIVDSIAGSIGEDAAYAGELRHRGEHSLELVAVWLHHVRGGKAVEIVPILVGSYYTYIMNGATPDSDAQASRVLDALQEAGAGRRVAVIASGDLSHVGSAFGGQPLTQDARKEVEAADHELIRHMRKANAAGFFESIRRVRDRHNVCGVSPVYLSLRLMGASEGEMHGYASCQADPTDTSAVTICGMVWR